MIRSYLFSGGAFLFSPDAPVLPALWLSEAALTSGAEKQFNADPLN